MAVGVLEYMKISLCIITRNDNGPEQYLRKCLGSIADLCDEVIVVDTGSTDGNEKVPLEFNDCHGNPCIVRHFEWIDDFSAARNFCFAQATQDWILWLDSDDYITEVDRKRFKALKDMKVPENFSQISCNYEYAFDKEGNPSYVFRRERILRRGSGEWKYPIHECWIGRGGSFDSDFTVSHGRISNGRYSDRNIKIFEKLIASGHELDMREKFYYANELRDHGRYEEAKTGYDAYIDAGAAWPGEGVQACVRKASICDSVDEKIACLVKSFRFGRTSWACYEIGNIYYAIGDLQSADFWYNEAVAIGKRKTGIYTGYETMGYQDVLPMTQLCVMAWNSGNKEKAGVWYRRAKEANPKHKYVIENAQWFIG